MRCSGPPPIVANRIFGLPGSGLTKMPPDALEYQETGLSLYEPLLTPQSDAMMHDEFALRHVRWANLLTESGQHRKALPHLERAVGILEGLYRADPENAAVIRDLVRTYNLRALVLLRLGQLGPALESGRQGATLGEKALAGEIGGSETRERLADSHEVIAQVLSKRGRSREAVSHSQEALSLRESLVQLDPANARSGFLLAQSRLTHGDALVASARFREAEESYGKAGAILEQMVRSDPSNALKRSALATVKDRLRTTPGRAALRRPAHAPPALSSSSIR
jgi:tetratricopeptide (TPR) repeat protein